MRVIVVGGSSSNVGKTALACRLLSEAVAAGGDWVAMKVSVREQPCGTVVSLLGQEERSERPDVDTQRLLGAGARRVVWVTTGRASVRDGLAAGLACARQLRPAGLVIESTSAGIELRRVDESWFIAGPPPWKPWAQRHRERADHVLPGEKSHERGMDRLRR